MPRGFGSCQDQETQREIKAGKGVGEIYCENFRDVIIKLSQLERCHQLSGLLMKGTSDNDEARLFASHMDEVVAFHPKTLRWSRCETARDAW